MKPTSLVGATIDGFEILEPCASGGFSVVHIARHVVTGLFCAVKIIDLSSQSSGTLNGIMNEISVFMQVSHPNLATLFRMSLSDETLLLFQEYFPNGTVLKHVNDQGGLPESECRRLFFQLYGVVRHLHLHHFLVHRDIKLENCLFDTDSNLRLVDFGLCSTTYQNTMRSVVGSPGYISPEVILGIEYTEKCDVFSLGVCLYLMRTGRLPFRAQIHDAQALRSEIENLRVVTNFSAELADLITKMLCWKQADRMGLLDIVRHPWMQGFPGSTGLVTPKPIMFFKLTKIEDLLKFRRKVVTLDSQVVAKVCDYLPECDETKLIDDLNNGLINDETTVYYLMMYPTVIDPRAKLFQKSRGRRQQRRQSDLSDPIPPPNRLIGIHRDRSLPRIARPDGRQHRVSPLGFSPRSGK
jgi:serine/threonine protein kinase